MSRVRAWAPIALHASPPSGCSHTLPAPSHARGTNEVG